MRPPPKLTEFTRYPVVAGTSLLAIGVTVASWVGLDVSPLFENPMIGHGEIWRVVTSIFPHLSVLHLVFNVYWLWVFGTLVEQVYGHVKTAGLFLLLTVGPNALEYAFASGGVGLSGVGYGLFGLLWVLSKRDERFREAIDNRTIQLFVGWFFFCIVLTVTNILPVGNIAHGAGAVLGILIGFAITLEERLGPIAAATGAIAFGLWAATLGRPKVNLSRLGGGQECYLGYQALQANHNQEALRWLKEAASYRTLPAGCWTELGFAHQQAGNQTAALAAYRKAAAMGDADGEYYLGSMYENGNGGLAKDSTQAISWYRKAADHGSPGVVNNVAWAFATSSDPAIRNPKAALEYAHKAVDADKDHLDPNHLDTLAEAYYVNGQYEEAVKTEQQVITLAGSVRNEFQKSLEKYQRAVQESMQETKAPPGKKL